MEQPKPIIPQPTLSEIQTPPRYGMRYALLSGLLYWLAHPPISLFPLAWFALVPLILSIASAKRPRQAFLRGYVMGLATVGTTCYWIGLTIVAWTHSPIGWLAWFFLTLILAGFYGAWSAVVWRFCRNLTHGGSVLALAASWVVMEWTRTLGTLTMPWAQLSYSQYKFTPLLQFTEITGAYGLSFLLVFVNVGIAYAVLNRKRNQPFRWAALGLFLMGYLSLWGLARMRLAETAHSVRVAAMQGNFSLVTTQETVAEGQEKIARLTADAARQQPGTEIYVWSESAAPLDALHDPSMRETLHNMSVSLNAGVMIGTAVLEPMTGARTNSSVLFTPESAEPQHYDKQQHVPFGEFIPFRSLWPSAIVQSFGFFSTDLTRGEGSITMTLQRAQGRPILLGAFICYESMYPHYPRIMAQKGANLLVTQSNDRWFQSRAAMEQHLSAVVLRAVENRRDVIRSTTNGVTCLIDSCGRITAEAPRDKEAFVTGTVNLHSTLSLATRLGDAFVWFCLALWGWLWARERKANGKVGGETA